MPNNDDSIPGRGGQPLPVPTLILAEILSVERERLGMTPAEGAFLFPALSAYWPDYCTDGPGYHGPLVVLVWPAEPGAMSSFIKKNGRWVHCNTAESP